MVRHDDVYWHCGRCGSDLTEDDVVTVELYRGHEVTVCEHCLGELADDIQAYERDPWYDNGVSIHDFI